MTPRKSSGRRSPFISLKDATFRLGDDFVFERTNWIFGAEDHWAIVGGNGSGKTLFAQALRGKLPLVGGELRYHFRAPDGLTPEDSVVQVSFEDRRIDARDFVAQSRWNSLEDESSLSVRNFLSFERVMEVNPFEVDTGRPQNSMRFEARYRKAVRAMGVEELLERHVLSLSNGELQKVHLARALCHPLRLLILDEPFTGLDSSARLHFRQILEELMRTRVRILILTASGEDLPRLITHVLRMEKRMITAVGRASREPLRGGNLEKSFSGARKTPRSTRANPSSSRPGKELVAMREVTVRYGSQIILDRVSWTIRKGESWALLGPNGSGKTTLLSLILGDHPQVYANDVTVFGIRRGGGESVWQIKRGIGWVSPELQVSFNGNATCYEVVASGFHDTAGLFERPTRIQRKKAHQWLRHFGLEKHSDWPMQALSAGEARCLLLARALVKSPQLLILDEPCQGLDRVHRETFLKELDRWIRRQITTVIFVTHRREEIPGSIRQVLRLKGNKDR